MSAFTPICRSIAISDLLSSIATAEQRDAGLDIADFLLMEDTPEMVLAQMIDRNPYLQTFIDSLQLKLVGFDDSDCSQS